MSFVTPSIQSRLRQLLGLRGGPLVDVLESVQPVVVLDTWGLQPQLAIGDTIQRKFVGSVIQAGVALETAFAAIRTTDPLVLIHVTEVSIPNGATAASYVIGRTLNGSFDGFGDAHFTDFRLGFSDLVATGLIEIGSATDLSSPAFTGGYRLVRTAIDGNVIIPVDYVLVSAENAGGLTAQQLSVQNAAVGGPVTAGFAGTIFQFGNR